MAVRGVLGPQKSSRPRSASTPGIATRRAVARVWTTLGPGNPPRSPSDPNATWKEAILWTTISAVGVAVAEHATTRGATLIWRNLIGGEPPPALTRD